MSYTARRLTRAEQPQGNRYVVEDLAGQRQYQPFATWREACEQRDLLNELEREGLEEAA